MNFELLEGWSNYHAMDFTLTKRFSRRWQAMATYTVAQFKDAEPPRDQWYIGSDGVVARRPIGFHLAPDLGGEYTLAGAYNGGGANSSGSQRHRAVTNGIWDLGHGFQLSGIYFFGSGERFRTRTNSDVRDEGSTLSSLWWRYRLDGTIIPRSGLAGSPIHRVDMQLQKRIAISERVQLVGIFEVFNVFNHTNYGQYTTVEGTPDYGKPGYTDNLAYQPRMLQLGFRTTF